MAGTQAFSRVSLAKETTWGTGVAPTRRFYGVATGIFDPGLGWENHREAARGVKTRIGRPLTQTTEDPTFKLQDAGGIGYDDLIQILSAGLRGGQSGAGAGADKTWTLISQNAASNTYSPLTAEVTDETQGYRVVGCLPTAWTLSTELGGLTHLKADLFGKQSSKVTAATPAEVQPVMIPAELWTIKQAATLAGLAGASVVANMLRSFSLTWNTGSQPRHYADGTLQAAQAVETDMGGTLDVELESTAAAVSGFYDKYTAGTMDFVRLKATGPTLGATNYSAQLDIPVYWTKPTVLSGDDNGVNIYKFSGDIAYDTVSAQSLGALIVCSLAAIP
jgi:hypothetical protein